MTLSTMNLATRSSPWKKKRALMKTKLKPFKPNFLILANWATLGGSPRMPRISRSQIRQRTLTLTTRVPFRMSRLSGVCRLPAHQWRMTSLPKTTHTLATWKSRAPACSRFGRRGSSFSTRRCSSTSNLKVTSRKESLHEESSTFSKSGLCLFSKKANWRLISRSKAQIESLIWNATP